MKDVRELAADHQAHDLAVGQIGGRPHRYQLAITQNGHAVAKLEDLLDAMGDINNGHTLVAQPAHQREEPLHLVVGK